MLIDNSIMQAFGAILDLKAETLTFSDNDVTVPAHHSRKSVENSSQNPACSVVVACDEIKPVPVYLPRNCVVDAGHEVAVRVFSKTAPHESTPAVIELRIATSRTIEAQGQHNVWDTIIVARTVTTGQLSINPR